MLHTLLIGILMVIGILVGLAICSVVIGWIYLFIKALRETDFSTLDDDDDESDESNLSDES